ncbi:MAG TPA: hypothetical protein PKA27_03125 [Fimbriimonadaceae bacterium]|nr:hypothetical protein [Fimbriimonadaceae bacterium]
MKTEDLGNGQAISQHMMATFGNLLPSTKDHGDPRYLRLITGEMHPLGNFVFVEQANDPDAVRTALTELKDVTEPRAVLFQGETSEAINQLVSEHGFQGPARMPLMAVTVADLAATPSPDGYEFVEFSSTNEEGWVGAMAEGYPIPHGLAQIFAPSNCAQHGGSDVRFFGVTKGDQVVATSMLYCTNGLAGIYCVATIPEERGKGLGALVTAEPLRRSGYKVGVLQSSEMGYPVYQRLGFEDLGGMSFFFQV